MRKLFYERGFIAKPKLYDLNKRFPEHAFMGYAGTHEGMKDHANDLSLLSKFYAKYPEVKYFP